MKLVQSSWTQHLINLPIYKSPRCDFTNFLKRFDLILQKLYNNKYNIIICSDVNVNYLIDDNRRSQLDAVLHSYNLVGIVEFATRFGLISQTAIDSVFIDTSTIRKYELYPFINRLSDHDAQLLILSNGEKKEKECHTYIKRKINKYTIADFQLKLSHETWACVFGGNDVNKIFNSFLNIFLRIYYSGFPLTQVKNKMNQNSWITPGIIISCKHKRELCKELQNNNNNNNNNNATLASYYRGYSKILSMVIRKAKRMEHDKLILNSHSEVKTTWGIKNKESGRNKKRSEVQALKVEGKKITVQQTIAETFNEYFVAIAKNVYRLIKNNRINVDNDNMDSHTHFMEQAFNKPYQSMECKCTTTKEIEQIMKSLQTKKLIWVR